jgi:hypothetical protein
MASIVSLNPAGSLQHVEFIIPDGMPVIATRAVYEISTENILQQVIPPINNRPPILENIYPLAIEWYSVTHYKPRFGTIIPQNLGWEADLVINLYKLLADQAGSFPFVLTTVRNEVESKRLTRSAWASQKTGRSWQDSPKLHAL